MIPNSDTITIRYANASDNLLLADLGAKTFAESFAKDNTPENMAVYLAASFSPEKQAQELADPQTTFLIAEGSAKAVGYARLKRGPAPECITGQQPIEIVRFYAIQPMIGKGVGARLMQASLEEAARRHCDAVWLDVWEQNPRAIAFYRKGGFVEAGRQTFQLGDDLQHDLLLQRILST
jgi:diamine N-acetyltransferase